MRQRVLEQKFTEQLRNKERKMKVVSDALKNILTEA